MTEQQHMNEGNYYHKNRDGESATSRQYQNRATQLHTQTYSSSTHKLSKIEDRYLSCRRKWVAAQQQIKIQAKADSR